MEWRCAWCGKPHEADDPPCDECGHDTFERAVVQKTAVESTIAWICPECGREHPKHNPPCSRCGHQNLERREITVDDEELTAPGYRDLLTPRYIAALVVVAGLGGLLLLGLAGVVALPGLSSGVPDVADVSGNATHLDGVSLTSVEAAYIDRASALRSAADVESLSRHERLDAVATYYNQRRVRAATGAGTVPSREELTELVGGPCGDRAGFVAETIPVPDTASGAEQIGNRLAERAFENGRLSLPAPRGRAGVDIHAFENRSLSVSMFAC